MDKEVRSQYDGSEIFSLTELANYLFYYTSTGQAEEFTVGTTLEHGNHEVELCFYIMDSKGMTVKGNGAWGRRFVDRAGQHTWICANDLPGWPESGDTIPIATQLVKQKALLNFNKYGETTIPVYDFLEGEMMVVADVLKDGKSVIADKLAKHDPKDDIVFDLSKLEDYLAVFRSEGAWYDDNPEACTFEIPVDLKDGKYRIELSYQLMNAEGKRLAGEGMWGRRIGTVDMLELTWLSEYAIEPHTKGISDMPLPSKTLKTEVSVFVKNGKCKILCLDFAQGEMMAVSAVKKISGSSERFDVATLKNYNNVFVGTGQAERFRVETTLCERGHFELEVTYYVMDKDGYMLMGNGAWGRRMMDERDEIWVCAKAPHKDHLDAENTIPAPTKAVTKKMMVTLNKKELSEVDAEKAYRIKIEQYGNYSLEFVATDGTNTTRTIATSIRVLDEATPEIQLKKKIPVSHKVGETLTFPELILSDNVTDAEKLVTWVNVIHPDGTMTYEKEAVELKEKGAYEIRFQAMDEAGNITFVTTKTYAEGE